LSLICLLLLPFDVKLIYKPVSNFRHWVDFDWINLMDGM